MLPPFGTGGIQPLTCHCRLDDSQKKSCVAAGAKANSEIHIMHATGAKPHHTLALVQQLLDNGFKSWIVGKPEVGQVDGKSPNRTFARSD